MILQDIELTSSNRLQLDLMDIPSSCVIVICDGKAKLRELPSFGEYKIVTHQGKVKRIRRGKRGRNFEFKRMDSVINCNIYRFCCI
nr:XtrA/YqaO family protein [Siminovitchia terrae]